VFGVGKGAFKFSKLHLIHQADAMVEWFSHSFYHWLRITLL